MDMPASLPLYFTNESVNKSVALVSCMDAIAEKVSLSLQSSATHLISRLQIMRNFINGISRKIVDHTLSQNMGVELKRLLVASSHRIAKTRDLAAKYLNRLIVAFPSLMCESTLVFGILDVLTLLRKACEGEFTDEVSSSPWRPSLIKPKISTVHPAN